MESQVLFSFFFTLSFVKYEMVAGFFLWELNSLIIGEISGGVSNTSLNIIAENIVTTFFVIVWDDCDGCAHILILL